jgi:hypothetical protein
MAADPGARASALDPDPVLGAPLGNYVSDRFRLLLIAGVAVLAIGLFLNFTVGAIQEGWGPPLTALLTAATVLGTGWWVLHWWNREVILYQRGFTVGEGARVVPIHYDEVARVHLQAERVSYLGLVRTERYRCTLTTIHDEQIVINGWYRRASDLGTRLNILVDAALRPQIEARWAAGESIPFNESLALSTDGLHSDGRMLAWADYGGTRIADGRLTILDSAGEAWASLPLASLDNLTLLIALLRERKHE